MPATIFARTAARRAAAFSTSTRAMKPSADSAAGLGNGSYTSTPTSSGSSWAWRNLSPKTRQYVKLGAATCAATDAVVLYNYPGLVGLHKSSE